jgi:spore maturation protein CgeB
LSLSILYLGDSGLISTARDRANALTRCGHRVVHHGLQDYCPAVGRQSNKLHYLTGHRLRQATILRRLAELNHHRKWDVVWVDSGWWCGPQVTTWLKTVCKRLVLVCCDDPFGGRDGRHWDSLKSAIPVFDLCVSFRDVTAADFIAAGAKKSKRMMFGYDEVAHSAASIENGIEELSSQVAFVGSRMENRHEFMLDLIRLGVPLSIWGDGWRNGPGWRQLRDCWRGPGLGGARYVAAIAHSKVCLGLLSRGNRDLHTTRSVEIPYAGGLLCAERTTEHSAMYHEGQEAVFWKDAEECAAACFSLLADPQRQKSIRAAGAAKVRTLGVGNESLVTSVLSELNVMPARSAAAR